MAPTSLTGQCSKYNHVISPFPLYADLLPVMTSSKLKDKS